MRAHNSVPPFLLASMLAVALLASACGGDAAGSDDDAAASGESQSGESDTATDDNPAGAEADGDGDDAESSDSAGGDQSSGDDSDGAPDGAADGSGPAVGEHWHAAYGVYVCDQFIAPLQDQSDPEGIHSHGDGVIHIHPFMESAAGSNATVAKFFEAMQIEVTDTALVAPGGSLDVADLDCPGGPAVFTLARWSLADLDADPALVDSDIGEVRFVEDLEVFTFGFAPAGTELPLPPSIASLGSISDVDPEDVPELPPGYTVAVVEPPEPGERIDGPTECPAFDGSAPRVTEFSEAPPMCIDSAATYIATFVTNYGDVVVELDSATVPETANNFVVLALYHYYDDTQLFRTAPSIDIIQGGAPHTNSASDPGPGYTIADEGDGFSYVPGDLAMARTPAPDSASAQFFFSAGPATANLDGPPGNEDGSGRGTYVRFGATLEGLEVLEEIMSLHVDDPALGGGGPGEPVILETVQIEQR